MRSNMSAMINGAKMCRAYSTGVAVCAAVLAAGMAGPAGANLVDVDVTLQEGVDGYSGTGDTHLREDGFSVNHGHADWVAARNHTSDAYVGLIRFDLSHIHDAVEVHEATLSLMPFQFHQAHDGEYTADVHRMLRSWEEGQGGSGGTLSGASWGYFQGPDDSGNLWTARPDGQTAAQGSGDRADTPTDSVSMSLTGGMEFDWVDIDVTDDVAAFLLDDVENWGWQLNETSNNRWVRFRSSEYADSAVRPVLNISYAVPEPATGMFLGGAVFALLMRRKHRLA